MTRLTLQEKALLLAFARRPATAPPVYVYDDGCVSASYPALYFRRRQAASPRAVLLDKGLLAATPAVDSRGRAATEITVTDAGRALASNPDAIKLPAPRLSDRARRYLRDAATNSALRFAWAPGRVQRRLVEVGYIERDDLYGHLTVAGLAAARREVERENAKLAKSRALWTTRGEPAPSCFAPLTPVEGPAQS